MKKKLQILLVFIMLTYIVWIVFHDLFVINNMRKLIDKAGGIEKVNEAVVMIFSSVDNGNTAIEKRSVLFEDEVPGFYRLGNAVYYVPEQKYNPRGIRIRRGNHFTYYSLYILDPRENWNLKTMGIVVNPNMVIVGKNRFLPFQF